jgi:hypothetical protein
VDTADPLKGTDNISIQPNTISCSNQNITHSVPVTISGQDNVQGKFIYYKFLHKKKLCFHVFKSNIVQCFGCYIDSG